MIQLGVERRKDSVMKLSRYNILKKIGNRTVFFNSMTCALAIVNNDFLQIIADIEDNKYNENKYNKDLIASMKQAGCIVDDDIDELDLIQFYRNCGKFNTSSLALTIAPTLDCNFRCPYCYEEHKNGIMTMQTQDALLSFIGRRISSIKKLDIAWYGGEPLLAKNVIYRLSENMIKVCKKTGVRFDAFIITNGSLLTDEDISDFLKYYIKGAQITIDGPKEIHDKRRISCNYQSTYEVIVANINKLLENNINVIVRINIDKLNINMVGELLNELKRKITKYNKIKIDFGKVSVFTDICKSVENHCFDNEQYANVMLPLYEEAWKRGFSMNQMIIYPRLRFNYCCFDYVNSYVVDVEGNLYKCWNHVGNLNMRCGNVRDKENIISGQYLRCVQWNPLTFDRCRSCNVLPICMGGCPDSAMKNRNTPVCDTIRYNLDKIIELYYMKLKGNVNTSIIT